MLGTVSTFLISLLYYISQTDITPIVPGQVWFLKGVGRVRIVRVLGDNACFDNLGNNIKVCYLVDDEVLGYASKQDIRNLGMLIQTRSSKNRLTRTRPEVDEVMKKRDDLLQRVYNKKKTNRTHTGTVLPFRLNKDLAKVDKNDEQK